MYMLWDLRGDAKQRKVYKMILSLSCLVTFIIFVIAQHQLRWLNKSEVDCVNASGEVGSVSVT